MRRKNVNRPDDISGVVQRQRRRTIGDFNSVRPLTTETDPRAKTTAIDKTINHESNTEDIELITEEDIIESTRSDIDKSKIGKKGWKARRKAKKLATKQKWARRPLPLRVARKIVRYGGMALILFGLYNAVITFTALNGIIDRGGDGALALQENIQPSALKGEGDGRINIMLLGIGGDGHKAGNLADSIIMASIDPFANEAAMLSIPRDMYVTIPGYYDTKVNAAHALDEDDPDLEGGGIELMKQTLEEILDISIHYYIRVDFQGFVEAIDNIGGIPVNLE